MLNDPRKRRPAINQRHRFNELDSVFWSENNLSGGSGGIERRQADGHEVAGRRTGRRAAAGAGGSRQGLRSGKHRLRLRGHAAGNIEVVDPEVGRALLAQRVQQQRIEIRFPIVHLRPKLHPQQMDLPSQ